MSWHAEPEHLAAYARGSLDQAAAFSLEAHLLHCDECRLRAVPLVETDRMDSVWVEVEEALDAPRPAPFERLLLRFGVADDVARLLAATPSLSLAWLLAVALALAFAVVAAQQGEKGVLAFLVLAPLLPVAGVAAAYAPGLDPAHEIALASPLQAFRLLLIRAVAVAATTTALAGVAALALPGLDWTVAAWLVPSFALTVLSLAASTYASPVTASSALAAAWIGAVVLGAIAADDRFVAFRAPAQATLAIAALVGVLVIAHRRERFEIVRDF